MVTDAQSEQYTDIQRVMTNSEPADNHASAQRFAGHKQEQSTHQERTKR